MSNRPVKASNYQTCVCGQVCRGRAALANHAGKCERNAIRAAFDMWCFKSGLAFVSDEFFNANFDAITAKLESR